MPWPLEVDGSIYTITRHYNDAIGSSTTRKVLSKSAMENFSDELKAKLQQYATFPNDIDKVTAGDTIVEFEWYSDAEYAESISGESEFTGNVDVYGKRKSFLGTEYGIQVATGRFDGTNLAWTIYDSFDEDTDADTLVISGTGAMLDYESAADTPWYDYKDTLKCLVLEEGVTHIGNYAFCSYTNNDFKFEGELNLPATITSIGEFAFTGTNGKFTGNLVLPEGITEIGKYAFAYNAFAGALILPEGLTEIKEYTFCGGNYYGANQFDYVVVPETVTTIGEFAFASGSYKYYNFSSADFNYYYYWNERDNRPENGFITVTKHYDDGAKTVTTRNALPDGVLEEDDYPYSNYPYADYHSFPNDFEKEYVKNPYSDLVLTWYSDAAYTTKVENATGFTAGNTYEYYAKSNHAGAYYASESVASGNCGAQGSNVTWTLLGEAESYTIVISGNGDMADYEAAKAPWNNYNSSTKKIIVNAGVTRIGNYAFYCCSATELELPDTLKSIGESAFERAKVSRNALILPEGVESVEKNAFKDEGYYGRSKIILPESLKQIGENAFSWQTTGGWIVIGSKAQMTTNVGNTNNFPVRYNDYSYIYFYNFSQIDIGTTWRTTYIADMPVITETIYSPDKKTSKTITRKILSSDQLPESDYPADTYPELVKYRTFPSDVDKVNGQSLTWYSDDKFANEVISLSGITEDTTVYAQCPGHEDADGDGKCDFCDYGKTLKITGVIEKEIEFTDTYTVPDYVYLVDDQGNRVTEVTESKELTALFAITTAAPVLTDSIAMDYTVRVAATETAVPKMTFIFNGKTYIPQAVAKETTDVAYKEYKFTISEINPSQMGDAITATVLLEDKTVVKRDYSVKAYCESVLGKDATALGISEKKYNELQELLVDLLYYGDEAQKYVGLGATATSGLTEEQKALRTVSGKNSPDDATSISDNSSSVYAWKSAALYLKDRVAVMLTFSAGDIKGLSIKVDMAGVTKEYIDFKKDANGNYYVILDGVAPGQYNSTMQAGFYKDDKQEGATLQYSVESYIYRKQNDEKLKNILQTILDYGNAAKRYETAD